MCMVYSLANVSGGHFNPAVTLAVMCTGSCGGPGQRRCRLIEGLFFMLAQVGAGITAALTYVCVHRGDSRFSNDRVADLGPKKGYGWTSVAIGETVFTMAVALSVLCMTTVRDPRYPKAPSTRSFQFAWAIGVCVTAGSFALEGITGGYLNPGVDIGVSVANFIYSRFAIEQRVGLLTHYLTYQMVGGVMAAIVFRMVHPMEYKEDPLLQ
uniref:Aquaporin n=1 Tax=Alexandrium andersonii TaxID=327968 RepID=A0A7S2HF57_9DINO